MEMINATGRRKCSVARVYLKKGEGNILVNGKDYKAYFPQEHVQLSVMAPLEEVEVAKLYDVVVNVSGGGFRSGRSSSYGYFPCFSGAKCRF